jgi:hypothetical protein
VGFWVLALGTLICLVPNKVKFQYARLPGVRVTEKYAATAKK